MLIKMKLPERKEHPFPEPNDERGIWLFYEDKGFNECREVVEYLNPEMEIDIEAFAKEMFEVCVYPGLEKWEEQTNHIKTRWRTNAEIIRDNAHVWLKEMGGE